MPFYVYRSVVSTHTNYVVILLPALRSVPNFNPITSTFLSPLSLILSHSCLISLKFTSQTPNFPRIFANQGLN